MSSGSNSPKVGEIGILLGFDNIELAKKLVEALKKNETLRRKNRSNSP